MPTFQHGKEARFGLDNASGTLVEISTYIENIELNFTREMADVTAHSAAAAGTVGHAFLPGLFNPTITLSGTIDVTDGVGVIDQLLDGALRATATRTWTFSPSGADAPTATTGSANNPMYSGKCWVTDYRLSSPVADKCAWTATLQVDGTVTRAVA